MSNRRKKRRGGKQVQGLSVFDPGAEPLPEEKGTAQAGDASASLASQRADRTGARDPSLAAFKKVGEEVLSSDLDPAAWAQALAECRGTKDDALALYARIRSESLSRSEGARAERKGEFETRRVGSFRDFSSVPVLRKPQPYESGLPGVIDSVFWHVLAGVGMAGCFLAARILWPGLFAGTDDLVLGSVVLLMQLIPVLAWWAGRGPRKSLTYSGTVQMSACVGLIGSVVLCVNLLSKPHRHLDAVFPLVAGSAAQVVDGMAENSRSGALEGEGKGRLRLVSIAEDRAPAPDSVEALVAENEEK